MEFIKRRDPKILQETIDTAITMGEVKNQVFNKSLVLKKETDKPSVKNCRNCGEKSYVLNECWFRGINHGMGNYSQN